jgi:ribonucleoside-diphosphate reductase alpha chain
MRRELPQRRQALNTKFHWEGHSLFLSTGYYHDGTLGEVFISAGKLQSGMDTSVKDAGIAISMALQHGCAVETLAHAFLRKNDKEPEGIAGAVMALIMKEGLDKIAPFDPVANNEVAP